MVIRGFYCKKNHFQIRIHRFVEKPPFGFEGYSDWGQLSGSLVAQKKTKHPFGGVFAFYHLKIILRVFDRG
ncbi:MAG: hypothetical protein A2908_00090 [Candidatus Staskawiczbacteria bacterium RIFCSPLOWO2_01_FULL_38_12b]|uniref:Uncharacterized protein n=1 Tax=Candidatus Staskawiczbacteria bacterium RIFCSPLOWO2_01_FULL_38_12b TaxID=1802214 RepID=A0A1G2IE02_9BACT|nr:MAG: hypothetical protein A2908_00090 [Candidatus Staskawiczbacteria bacterium RIFCSPLOWO2_01_FULL_38_12b]